MRALSRLRSPASPVPLPSKIIGTGSVGRWKPLLRRTRRLIVLPTGTCSVSQPEPMPSVPSGCSSWRTISSSTPSAAIEAMEYSRMANGTRASTSACACRPTRWARFWGSWRLARACSSGCDRSSSVTVARPSMPRPSRKCSIAHGQLRGSTSTRSPASQLLVVGAARPSRYTPEALLSGLSNSRRIRVQWS
ncbi:hypothetical protein D3C87_1346610 [compost metagenome]